MYVRTEEMKTPFIRLKVKDDILTVETHNSSSKLKVSWIVSDEVELELDANMENELVKKHICLGTGESKHSKKDGRRTDEVRSTLLHIVQSFNLGTLNETESEEEGADFP